MREYGARRQRIRATAIVLVTLVVVLWTSSAIDAQVVPSDPTKPNDTEPSSLTPVPSPSQPSDDCSACCSVEAHTNTTLLSSDTSLACCSPEAHESNLYSTTNGYCSGLPCCAYRGRRSQRGQAWFPCLLFPTCMNDPNKQAFCSGDDKWYFTDGSSFQCTDGCCAGPKLESNVWSNVANAFPGQTNGTFAVLFNPSELKRAFFEPADRDTYPLVQIVLASPPDYTFGRRPTCLLTKTQIALNATTRTTCSVSKFNGTTHLAVDIPPAYRTNETFTVTFDRVRTPSGVAPAAPEVYATGVNLVPVYFQYKYDRGFVFSSFYRLAPLTPSALASGSFVPENIYPGNSGNATLSFYSSARILKGSTVELRFTPRWLFPLEAKTAWTWEVVEEEDGDDDDDVLAGDAQLEALTDGDETGSADDSSGQVELMVAPVRAGPKTFAAAKFVAWENRWRLTLDKDWAPGWIVLGVDQVQNPAVAYTGLNLASIEVFDAKERLVSRGVFSAISVEFVSEPVASPYTYVTVVVLTGTLLFCTVVIRSNGLAFSMGSIWTDLTAICTLLALITAIVNNLVWVISRSCVYFYLSRIFLCFTFTMLTAVCFHWGTVLNLHLRRLPQVKTVVAFVTINLVFYTFQAVFLFKYQDLIARVYELETNTKSFANQQCKDREEDTSNSVFSEIQGYLWSCYAEKEHQFFLVSTTVTSALFLALTVLVMALGVMVMRRGKLLLGTSTGPHQVVLVKALRLYYALIGVVTVVYLLSWVVQLISRGDRAISYPWFYIFTVWLPQSIPPCCLIFLQWNSTAKSLRDADLDPAATHSLSDGEIYDEIRTPSFTFSSSERWSDEDGASDVFDDDDDDCDGSVVDLADATYARGGATDDFVGLSMSLETNEEFPLGCFVAIQRLVVDPLTGGHVWRHVSNTDTVEASRKDTPGSVSTGRHAYSFMAVPRIPLTSLADDQVRLVVYSVNASPFDATRTDHHSEMTVARVLAAMDQRCSADDDDDSQFSQTTSTCGSIGDVHATRVIDELFELESEPESTDAFPSLLTSLSIVAEFTVSTDVLVTSGARGEQVALVAAEHSYKQSGLDSVPPKMLVHTVLPKATRTKYGLAGVANGMASSHSMSSQYHIRELGLLVVEDLTESRFTNWIPRQILEVTIRHRSKQFLIAQNDLARLEAFDRQRQKGCDRGIYENLIQQIQDDGDINRCREWMIQRCQTIKEYIDMLRRLRKLYVGRDLRKQYFKPSTAKKDSLLRFLPINLHLQEMWVGPTTASFNTDDNKASVYDIVTVGAMAAHVYKFKNGGLLGLQEQRTKMKPRRRERLGSVASARQSPLWTEDEQKADAFDWEIQKRMDVCFPQAAAALVTAFTRKIDLALQHSQEDVGREMLQHLEKLGFLFNVESLVSTHGNEAGMLEDMAGALNELRHVRFVLVDEQALKPEAREISLSFDVDEEMKAEEETHGDARASFHKATSGLESAANGPLAGVVDVNVFTSLEQALATKEAKTDRRDTTVAMVPPPSPAHSIASSSFSHVGNRLINTIRSGRLFSVGKPKSPSPGAMMMHGLCGSTTLVIRVKVRTNRVPLPGSLAYGGTINVTPVLFTQGINEKQTLANNTHFSATRLQDAINESSLQSLRTYADRYAHYMHSMRTRGSCPSVSSCAISRDQVSKQLSELDKLISSSKQTRKKRPEILQLSSDLCRQIGAGRVTVCKSAKDRTGMSVTLEQGRILVQRHGLAETKKAGIVTVMRSEGVRIENALKNTGRRVFAFNALQRSLLPDEYRCPAQTAGKNVS